MKPLSEEEALSPLWRRLKLELEEALADEREANDHACDEITTAYRRGNIARIKELLDLQQTVDLRADEAEK